MIYLHVPFCRSFCIYCDFYSEICPRGQVSDVILWKDEVLDEIRLRSDAIARSRITGPDTLYIGGGTPSVVPPEILREIVESLGPADYREFTVEVNPDDVTPELSRTLKSMGVNRVSMGVQSFNDGTLRWMNRRHSAQQAREAVQKLRDAGVTNISIDLIFGIAGMSDQEWEKTVAEAMKLRPEHISCYALSIEEGSALARMVEDGRYTPASDEDCRRQYDMLCGILAREGYHHYEISNFALPGFEAVHNSAYWDGSTYVGIGPGAHSYDAGAKVRSWNSQSTPWTSEQEHLSEEDLRTEKLMLGLRTSRGLAMEELQDLADPSVLKSFISSGAIISTPEGRMRIAEEFFFVSDDIISEII